MITYVFILPHEIIHEIIKNYVRSEQQ